MNSPQRPAGRGRPPTITRARIADAGIAMGLPNITFVGLAAALGVSHMALYKHVPSLDELKRLVADEIFSRWDIPRASSQEDLQQYLCGFAAAVQAFVKAHPGVTPYVIRRLAASEAMIAKIDGHQRHVAEVYGMSKDQARWLLATVAFHGMAVADTVYSVAGRDPAVHAERAQEESEMESELGQGMQALIFGLLAMLESGVGAASVGGRPGNVPVPV